MSDERTAANRPAIEWDDGVASERTVLAWQRTALSTLVVALLVIRTGIVDGPIVLGVPLGTLLVAVACWEWLFSRRIYFEHDRPHAVGAKLHDGVLLLLALTTVIAAIGAAILAVNA